MEKRGNHHVSFVRVHIPEQFESAMVLNAPHRASSNVIDMIVGHSRDAPGEFQALYLGTLALFLPQPA